MRREGFGKSFEAMKRKMPWKTMQLRAVLRSADAFERCVLIYFGVKFSERGKLGSWSGVCFDGDCRERAACTPVRML